MPEQREFEGTATPRTPAIVGEIAGSLGIPELHAEALINVFAPPSGFLPDNRPVILFERDTFRELTGGAHDETADHVSAPLAGGYAGGEAEYDRLDDAIALDRAAALKSTRWGTAKLSGMQAEEAGFGDVEAMATAMSVGEDEQIRAWQSTIVAHGLHDALQEADWRRFARAIDGPAYVSRRHDLQVEAEIARLEAAAATEAAKAEDEAQPEAQPAPQPAPQPAEG